MPSVYVVQLFYWNEFELEENFSWLKTNNNKVAFFLTITSNKTRLHMTNKRKKITHSCNLFPNKHNKNHTFSKIYLLDFARELTTDTIDYFHLIEHDNHIDKVHPLTHKLYKLKFLKKSIQILIHILHIILRMAYFHHYIIFFHTRQNFWRKLFTENVLHKFIWFPLLLQH
jgi:hypothetical protein